jgi:hypothetical protein
MGNLGLGQALAQEFGDAELCGSEPGTLKPENAGEAVENLVHIAKAQEDAAEGAFFDGRVDGGAGEVQGGAVDVDGFLLQRGIQDTEPESDAQAAVGETRIDIPEQVGYGRTGTEEALEFVAESYNKPGEDSRAIFFVDKGHEGLEALLDGGTLGRREIPRASHIGNESDAGMMGSRHGALLKAYRKQGGCVNLIRLFYRSTTLKGCAVRIQSMEVVTNF